MKPLLLAAALLLPCAAASSRGGAALSPVPSLTLARVCTANLFDDVAGLCAADARGAAMQDETFLCSVYVHVPRPTRFAIRLTYEGARQRGYSTVVRSDGPRSLRVSFPTLGRGYFPPNTPFGLPGGRYRCEFALGSRRATVAFRSRGPTGEVLHPHACRPTGGADAAGYFCDGGPSRVPRGHTVACVAVFARLAGRKIETEVFARAESGATLLHSRRAVIKAPVQAQWTYTSAPSGSFLPDGDYECRFRIDGRTAAAVPFTIARS